MSRSSVPWSRSIFGIRLLSEYERTIRLLPSEVKRYYRGRFIP